ncbi:MAG: phosphoglucosamine mutase, partial [Acidocella sp.]|nr:phosphoglucosamine mutase [Acidocella sp.]
DVGDRYVAEAMRAGGRNVGGEQSGHVILSDFGTTGDGLIAALQVLAAIVDEARPASVVCRVFAPLPQILRNVRYRGESPLARAGVQAAIAEATARLDGVGRLLVRPSGTETLIRVMAEGEDAAMIEALVGTIVAVIEQEMAG